MRISKLTSFLLRLSVSAGLVTYFLVSLSRKHGGIQTALATIVQHLQGTRISLIILAFSLIFIGLFLMSFRWLLLLKVYSREIRLRELFAYYLMAAFFNNFLPSTVGGDSLRVMKSQKLMGKTSKSVTVVILERLTGLVALAIIAFLAFLLKYRTRLLVPSGGNMIIFLLGALVFFLVLITLSVPRVARFLLRRAEKPLPAKLHRFLAECYEAVFEYYRCPRYLAGAILVSLVHQFNMVIYYFFILRGIGVSIGFGDCMLKVPVVIFLLMVIPAVNGLGVRTASFSGLMGLASSKAMGVEAIDLGIRLLGGGIGGMIFLFRKDRDLLGKKNRAIPGSSGKKTRSDA